MRFFYKLERKIFYSIKNKQYGIDWVSNCKIGNESFLPCELQFLINQYTGLVYGIGFIVIVLAVFCLPSIQAGGGAVLNLISQRKIGRVVWRACRAVAGLASNLDFSKCDSWRRGWDSNPRVSYLTLGFRDQPVMTTSVPLHANNSCILTAVCDLHQYTNNCILRKTRQKSISVPSRNNNYLF